METTVEEDKEQIKVRVCTCVCALLYIKFVNTNCVCVRSYCAFGLHTHSVLAQSQSHNWEIIEIALRPKGRQHSRNRERNNNGP